MNEQDEMSLKSLALQIATTFPHNSEEQDMAIAEYVVEALHWLYQDRSAVRLSVVAS